MTSHKKKLFIAAAIVAIVLIIAVIVYFIFNPVFIVLGQKFRLYSVHTTELDLRDNHLLTNEERQLTHFKSLKKLNLRTVRIDSLEFLDELDNLEELQFGYYSTFDQDSYVLDYSPLYNQSGLKVLSLLYLTNTCDDISFLYNMPLLEELEISFCVLNDEQLNVIGDINTLKYLNLGCSNFDSLEPLMKLTNLETLELCNCKIKDLSSLYEISSLKDISLPDVKVDLTAFLNMENLEVIVLEKTLYTEDELNILRNNGIEVMYYLY